MYDSYDTPNKNRIAAFPCKIQHYHERYKKYSYYGTHRIELVKNEDTVSIDFLGLTQSSVLRNFLVISHDYICEQSSINKKWVILQCGPDPILELEENPVESENIDNVNKKVYIRYI